MVQCKNGESTTQGTSTPPITKELPKGQRLSVNILQAQIGDEPWAATNASFEEMGNMWMVRGADDSGRVFSITLPKPLETGTYEVLEGKDILVTYSVSRKEGWVYKAPAVGLKPGTVTITSFTDQLVQGTFEATITNGGRNKAVTNGRFTINR